MSCGVVEHTSGWFIGCARVKPENFKFFDSGKMFNLILSYPNILAFFEINQSVLCRYNDVLHFLMESGQLFEVFAVLFVLLSLGLVLTVRYISCIIVS